MVDRFTCACPRARVNSLAGGTVAAGKCVNCHNNAGATVNFIPGTPGANFNFDTGVEDLPDQPADLIDPGNNPPDDGFGSTGSFNTPPLVEAADTGPFFHNNSIETIEEAVNFYNSDAFNNSAAGMVLAGADSFGIGIDIEVTQVVAVAALLRVLNALENIRSAEESATFAQGVYRFRAAKGLLRLAIPEVEDAIEVLDGGGLHPDAQQVLQGALNRLKLASRVRFKRLRNRLIGTALNKLAEARDDMVG